MEIITVMDWSNKYTCQKRKLLAFSFANFYTTRGSLGGSWGSLVFQRTPVLACTPSGYFKICKWKRRGVSFWSECSHHKSCQNNPLNSREYDWDHMDKSHCLLPYSGGVNKRPACQMRSFWFWCFHDPPYISQFPAIILSLFHYCWYKYPHQWMYYNSSISYTGYIQFHQPWICYILWPDSSQQFHHTLRWRELTLINACSAPV